jgi:multicomponent Na+:H+ antiporter subunit E
MNPAVLTLLLALGWAAATGSFTVPNLLFGALVGGFCLYLIRGQIGGRRFWSRARRMIALGLLFLKELILSALRVAALVLRPQLDLRPALVAFPLTVTSDVEITLLANLITLTPGTLSVDVSADRKRLLIHAIDVADREALIRSIQEGLEAKVMEACR